MIQTDQQYPLVSSQNKELLINPDGSVDVYFGPKAPAGSAKVIMYQPQVDEWKDHATLAFRSAVAVTEPREKKENYGVLAVEVQTDTDFQGRSVLLQDFQITDIRFPNRAEQEAAALERIMRDTLPKDRKVVFSLDRVLAYMEQDPARQRAVEVNLEPPAIFYSSKPAVLMVFIGKPESVSVKDTALMAAVNTNWDLFLGHLGMTLVLPSSLRGERTYPLYLCIDRRRPVGFS
jgi:hypothetical protein